MTEEATPTTAVATDEERQAAAREFAEAFTAFAASMEKCHALGVDITAELELQGLDVPPVLALMLGQ